MKTRAGVADWRAYPKPGPVGGRLIRQVIAALREQNLKLPVSSHILCAASGGADSTALAHLIAKYGRRVVDPSRLVLLHINHGWRGAASDADARFVRELATHLKVGIKEHRLTAKHRKTGDSWEEAARRARKSIYEKAATRGTLIFTAHHADDLAETLVWRIFTGAAGTAGGGILARDGSEIRPFLRVRKSELKEYLKEEGQSWREDQTNDEGRFLRSRMRQTLMPEIEALFPHAVRHLVDRALELQKAAETSPDGSESGPEFFLQMAGLRLKRAHFESIRKGQAELHLPGGWKMIRERPARKSGAVIERWVLERTSPGPKAR